MALIIILAVLDSGDEIIARLYESRELNECLEKLIEKKYRDDFKQELFVILLNNREKVISADSRGELIYYVVRIILNLSKQSRNVFVKKYINKSVEYTEKFDELPDESDESFEDRCKKEEVESKIIEEIEKIDGHFGTFYYRVLVKLVAEEGSQSRASKKIGIPRSSISKAVKRVREYLNNNQ